jgi:lactate dehydrogenase-like 2-hydroxyacid dehydrogenase
MKKRKQSKWRQKTQHHQHQSGNQPNLYLLFFSPHPHQEIKMFRLVAVPNKFARMYASSPAAKIGFIGLGNMGAHMARNLIKAGHQLVVFDLSADATNALAQAGAKVWFHIRFGVNDFVAFKEEGMIA